MRTRWLLQHCPLPSPSRCRRQRHHPNCQRRVSHPHPSRRRQQRQHQSCRYLRRRRYRHQNCRLRASGTAAAGATAARTAASGASAARATASGTTTARTASGATAAGLTALASSCRLSVKRPSLSAKQAVAAPAPKWSPLPRCQPRYAAGPLGVDEPPVVCAFSQGKPASPFNSGGASRLFPDQHLFGSEQSPSDQMLVEA